MFSRPLVRAVSSRPRSTLAWDLSSRFWLNGSLTRAKSKPASAAAKAGSSEPAAVFVPFCCAAAFFAALAFAICSRNAADVFLYDWPGSAESVVIAVLPDATDVPETLLPSPDVADEPRETRDAFLVVSGLACAEAAAFLTRPLTEARLLSGRGTGVFEADLGVDISGPQFPGLGVLARGGKVALSGPIPYIDVRPCLTDAVFADDSWRD
ncbi:hypothetical protein VTH06DRAFT_7223 [Thermothelomyces fergusii]